MYILYIYIYIDRYSYRYRYIYYIYVNFLDLNLSLRTDAISTDLYVKLTDGHQCLHYKSSHPKHIKSSTPYSQALRLSRICSSEKNFRGHVDRMKEGFLARDCPENAVDEQIKLFFVRAILVGRVLKMVFF